MTTTHQSAPRAALGFAQPTTGNYEATVFTRDALKAGMSQMAYRLKPTALLTLTVKEPRLRRRNDDGQWLVSDLKLLREANFLLYCVNSAVFGRKYQKHGVGLTGFGCIETQANHQPHLHLAITNAMPPKRFLKIDRAISLKSQKTKYFTEAGIDFRLVGGEDADRWRLGSYLGKEGRLMTLGPGGVY